MEFTDSYNAFKHIGIFRGHRLVEHSLVSIAGRTGLVRIYSRNDNYFVLYFILNEAEARDIINNRIFSVSGAGSDDEQEFIRFAGKYLFYLLV